MADVFLDAFIDSLKLLAAVLIFTYIIALIEPKVSDKVRLKGKLAPLIGVSLSILPQCGFSVVATDLYHRRHITLGTLIGVYLATSDEALPVFLAYPEKALHILPILAAKFLLGVLFGYVIDLIFRKDSRVVEHHLKHCEDEYKIHLSDYNNKSLELIENCSHGEENLCGCEDCINSNCPHPHMHCSKDECALKMSGNGILSDYKVKKDKVDKKRKNVMRFGIKPLLHSLEIFIYVLIINMIFAVVLYFVGEDKIISFLMTNKFLSPLFAVIVGIIPNCASSVVISKLYIMGGIGFGAALGGLCMNAGVAFIYLFKDAKHTKQNLIVFFMMFIISVAVSYLASLPFDFAPLPF